ncbi:MAG: 5'/3'-nucleotidase SurE [Spirochaetes bacterium GWF1_51_8]|nr:MAG: 5'/3'-nucleotidase SurE [Spirochaetes bacterium GWF1_51_8]
MKILLTNDDGYHAEGLKSLEAALSRDHEVYTVAPLKQMSGSGHSFHLGIPMELIEVGPRSYAMDGSPADCVKSGLFGIFPGVSFDLVISGINDGPNLGHDLYYSGTVAGAREGMFNGLFSIALSIDGWDTKKDFKTRSEFIRVFLKDLLEKSDLETEAYLNINFPAFDIPRGIRVTFPGKRVYKDYIKFENTNEKRFVLIDGDFPAYISLPGSDLDCVQDGYISVTPISADYDNEIMKKKFDYLNRDFYEA